MAVAQEDPYGDTIADEDPYADAQSANAAEEMMLTGDDDTVAAEAADKQESAVTGDVAPSDVQATDATEEVILEEEEYEVEEVEEEEEEEGRPEAMEVENVEDTLEDGVEATAPLTDVEITEATQLDGAEEPEVENALAPVSGKVDVAGVTDAADEADTLGEADAPGASHVSGEADAPHEADVQGEADVMLPGNTEEAAIAEGSDVEIVYENEESEGEQGLDEVPVEDVAVEESQQTQPDDDQESQPTQPDDQADEALAVSSVADEVNGVPRAEAEGEDDEEDNEDDEVEFVCSRDISTRHKIISEMLTAYVDTAGLKSYSQLIRLLASKGPDELRERVDALPPPAPPMPPLPATLRAPVSFKLPPSQHSQRTGVYSSSSSSSSKAAAERTARTAAKAVPKSSLGSLVKPIQLAPLQYQTADAPLALLRLYVCRGKGLLLRDSHILFEEDNVQYPTRTLTPLRSDQGSSQCLNLSTLWLLISLGDKYADKKLLVYEEKRIPDIMRISQRHVPGLLDYLHGRATSHELLLDLAETKKHVPKPQAEVLVSPPFASPSAPPEPIPELQRPPIAPQPTSNSSAKPKSKAASPAKSSTTNDISALDAGMAKRLVSLKKDLDALRRRANGSSSSSAPAPALSKDGDTSKEARERAAASAQEVLERQMERRAEVAKIVEAQTKLWQLEAQQKAIEEVITKLREQEDENRKKRDQIQERRRELENELAAKQDALQRAASAKRPRHT